MAINNVNVQYDGGFLPDIILWTQCYLHRGTCLNAMKRFCICSILIPPKRFDIFSPITAYAFFQHAHFIPRVGVRKERRILTAPW